MAAMVSGHCDFLRAELGPRTSGLWRSKLQTNRHSVEVRGFEQILVTSTCSRYLNGIPDSALRLRAVASHSGRCVIYIPRLSEFYGIVYVYWKDHAPPHFHAISSGQETQIRTDGGRVLAVPSQRRRSVSSKSGRWCGAQNS